MIKRLPELSSTDKTLSELSGELLHFPRATSSGISHGTFRKTREDTLFFSSTSGTYARGRQEHPQTAGRSTDSASRRADQYPIGPRVAPFLQPYSIVVTSPLPETGIDTASFTWRISSQFASPL
jgi:hypothetical protein